MLPLYYTIPLHTIVYETMLHYALPFYTKAYYTMIYYTIPYYTIPLLCLTQCSAYIHCSNANKFMQYINSDNYIYIRLVTNTPIHIDNKSIDYNIYIYVYVRKHSYIIYINQLLLYYKNTQNYLNVLIYYL